MDVNVGFIYKDFGYREYMWEVFSCIPLDLLPISIVLVYHRKNSLIDQIKAHGKTSQSS